MEIFFYCILCVLGSLFGSFASVIISRLRSSESGIFFGRSHCISCERDLGASELIPVISWIFQGGKCKGCQQKISYIYPLLEIATGILFVCVGYFLITPELIFLGDTLEIFRLVFFLSIIFFTVIFVFYDILYLEIPEGILGILNILVICGLIVQGFGIEILPYGTVGGLSLGVGILCIGVVISLYTILLAGLKEIYDIAIICISTLILSLISIFGDISLQSSALLSGIVAALGVFISFFIQIIISKGRWMGAGDLRIAIALGLIAGISFAFPAWMLTYIIGSIVGILLIFLYKIFSKESDGLKMQVPFGPFLACGYLGVLFFHPYISSFIELYF